MHPTAINTNWTYTDIAKECRPEDRGKSYLFVQTSNNHMFNSWGLLRSLFNKIVVTTFAVCLQKPQHIWHGSVLPDQLGLIIHI